MRVNIEQADRPINGSLMDVSSGGMKVRILTRKHFLFNQNLFVRILNQQKTYKVACRVRWQKEDPIDHSHMLGLQFSGLDQAFCQEILQLELGSKAAPYRHFFPTKERFLAEFENNIRHGGFRLRLDAPLPPLHRDLFVELHIPNSSQRCLIFGEVVAHVSDGVGIFIKNHTQVLRALQMLASKSP